MPWRTALASASRCRVRPGRDESTSVRYPRVRARDKSSVIESQTGGCVGGLLSVFALFLAPAACGDVGVSECGTPYDSACAPLYSPTFANVFSRTLKPSCGLPGANCHGGDGAKAGLAFVDEQRSYELLLGTADGRARLASGAPQCGVLPARIGSMEPERVMPPGRPLSGPERCSILLWIAQGALR